MLINTNSQYNENDVVSFKLIYGDEIVSRFVKEDDSSFTVTRPLAMAQSASGIGLMQAMLTIYPDNEFVIQKSHIVMHGLTEDTIANHHREVTTGLKIVRTTSDLPSGKVVHHNNLGK